MKQLLHVCMILLLSAFALAMDETERTRLIQLYKKELTKQQELAKQIQAQGKQGEHVAQSIHKRIADLQHKIEEYAKENN